MADAPRPHDDPAATAPPREPPLSPPPSTTSPLPTSSVSAPPAALGIPPPPSLSPPQALQRALDRARDRLRPIIVAEGAIAVVAAVTAAMLIAALVLTLAPFSQPLRSALLVVVVVAAVAAVAHVWFWRGRMLTKDLWVGARLQDALARRGMHTTDAVAGAIELRDQALDTRLGRSRALCDAHIQRTVAMLDEHRAHQSLPAVGLEQALPTLLGAAGVFGVLVVSLAFAHEALAKRWLQLLSQEAAAVAVAERAALEPPLVTDLTLTLRYPAYMARADEVIAGASGDVTAPRGTEVVVEGRADIDVSAAAIVLSGGPEELSLQAQVDGRHVRGRFTVAAPGAWRFKLTSEGGERLDPAARQILVKADAAPTVRLEHPSADETVQPDDEIKVVYSADDDFGITSVRLVVRRQGSGREPFVQVLAKDLASVKQSAGGGVVALRDIGARPGEKLALVVEVLDNDTISGPNIGRSATRVLTVFSAAAHHREVIERLKQLLGHLVEVLGDELESSIPPAADAAVQRATIERQLQLMPRAQQMLTFFDETLAAVAKDTEFDDDDDDSGVRRALANMRLQLAQRVAAKHESVERTPRPSDRALPLGMWRRLVDAQQALVIRLENDILYVEDLLQRERLREAQKLVQDLRAAQQDLKTLLQQYKDSGDASAREALLEEIKRMQQQLAELAARLGELRSEVPDEFFNEEAFQSDEMMQDASSLDELIEEGRLEDAAAALQKMLDSTEKMMEGLDDASDEVGGQEGKALREQMERFGEDLSSLETAQKEALQETEALMEKARKRAEERLGQKAQAALQEAARLADKAKAALEAVDARQAGLTPYEEEDLEASSSRTSELQSALESGDITDAQRAVEEAESAARSAEASLQERLRRNPSFQPAGAKAADAKLQEAIEALRDARAKLETASPDPTEMLDAKDKERLQRSAERQAQLQEQANKLAEQMAEMQKAAPLFGQKHQQQLDAAQQAMGQASQQLKGQGQPRPERGGLRRARQSQSQALQQLQGLKDAMEQMGKESGGGGMPMPLPQGGSPGSERSEGQRGKSNRDDVKIPDGSDFKVKDAFRKDILDAMREGAPGEWAGEVKRYYEELIK